MLQILYQNIEDDKNMRISKYIFFWPITFQKYNKYWNDILFFTNYSDLSFLILSKNGVPSSSLASRLSQTQVFLFLTYFLKYEF